MKKITFVLTLLLIVLVSSLVPVGMARPGAAGGVQPPRLNQIESTPSPTVTVPRIRRTTTLAPRTTTTTAVTQRERTRRTAVETTTSTIRRVTFPERELFLPVLAIIFVFIALVVFLIYGR